MILLITLFLVFQSSNAHEEIIPIQRSYSVSNDLYPINDKRAPENIVDVVACEKDALFVSSQGEVYEGNEFSKVEILNERGDEIDHLPYLSKLMYWDAQQSIFVAHAEGFVMMKCSGRCSTIFNKSSTIGHVNDIAIKDNEAWIATKLGLWLFRENSILDCILSNGEILAIDIDDRGVVYAASKEKFYIVSSKERRVIRWEWVSNVQTGQGGVINDVITSIRFVSSKNRTVYIGTRLGLTVLNLNDSTFSNLNRGVLPVSSNLTSLTYDSMFDRLWIGTTKGLIVWDPSDRNSIFLNSTRWLAGTSHSKISTVIIRENNVIVVKPNDGVTFLQIQRNWTLLSKANYYENILQDRHGLVTSCQLQHFATLQNCTKTDSDNDGLWTGLVLAAQLFRSHIAASETEREDARMKSSTFLRGILNLNRITGKQGFMARSLCSPSEWNAGTLVLEDLSQQQKCLDALEKTGTCGGSKDTHDREHWKQSTVKGFENWYWKDDTSSDEVVGHAFSLLISSILSHSSQERDEARKVLLDIVESIVKNGYLLIGTNNQSTTWGTHSCDSIM